MCACVFSIFQDVIWLCAFRFLGFRAVGVARVRLACRIQGSG